MAKTYYLSSTNSDLGGGADFSAALDHPTPGGDGARGPFNVAAPTTEVSYGFTPPGDPGVDGTTGDYTVEVNVDVANANISISIQLHRVNSAGTVQASSSITATQSAGSTGVKTFSLTAVDLGTWATDDRLRVDYRFTAAGHGNQAITIGTGTTDEEVLTPFADIEPNARPDAFYMAVDLVDAVYRRQALRKNSSGFMRVPVIGEAFVEPLARPVVVRLSPSPVLRKGMAVHPRLSAPAAIDLSPQTSFLSISLVASPLAGRATNVRLAPPSVVEDAPLFIADGLQLNLARTQARASVVRSFLTAFDETTVPPEPPEPPAQPPYPTSPPPPRLGGASAW